MPRPLRVASTDRYRLELVIASANPRIPYNRHFGCIRNRKTAGLGANEEQHLGWVFLCTSAIGFWNLHRKLSCLAWQNCGASRQWNPVLRVTIVLCVRLRASSSILSQCPQSYLPRSAERQHYSMSGSIRVSPISISDSRRIGCADQHVLFEDRPGLTN